MLKAEFKKTRTNYDTVQDLMDRTFALRRKDILENTYDLNTIFTLFPFLQESEQVKILLLSAYLILCCCCLDNERIGSNNGEKRLKRGS